jgi:hypothetical protein
VEVCYLGDRRWEIKEEILLRGGRSKEATKNLFLSLILLYHLKYRKSFLRAVWYGI